MSKFMILLIVLLNWEGKSLGLALRGARLRNGQFPWLIQFQTIVPCGGILVSPDWVLTAAQCVQYKRNSITLYAASLNGTGSRQVVGVKATYIFPEYQAYSRTLDHEHNIALLKLAQPFDMCGERVQLLDVAPVRLGNAYKKCLIFGWQSYVAPSTKVLAKPIQYSEVLLNSWKVCTYVLKGNTSYNNVFCTMVEAEDGLKACAGNPGSPVVCEDHNKKMTLLGIASWSNFSLECGGIPTYLAVSLFRSWMNDLIFNEKKSEERDTGMKSRKGICGSNQNLGSTDSRTVGWNYSNPLEPGHQQGVDYQLNKQTINDLLGPPQSKLSPKLDNPLHTDFTKISSRYGIPFETLRDRDDNLKQYHEVGQGKEDPLGTEDLIIVLPVDGEKPGRYLDQPNMRESNFKDPKKAVKIDLESELDDSEFMISLYEDYFTGKSSSLYFRSFEYITVLYLLTLISCIAAIF